LDGIPGIKGMGEKTAKKLLADYGGNIENIFAHMDDLEPRVQRLLRGKEEEARQSKYLATIVCDVPVQLDLAACRVGQINQERAVELFRELEFRTLIDKITGL
jgi:DNA polymerase-1